MDKFHEDVIKLSYSHFDGRLVTADAIYDYIERSRNFFPEACLDGDWLFRRIEGIYSVFIGSPDFIDSNTDHIEWFNPSTNSAVHREIDWHFWDHYRQYMISRKAWPEQVVRSVDNLSSEILSRIEDPYRDGVWDRRGMVVGSVQSGKTANYSALISKAADSGYKLFVVLAGVHNSLRSQTQVRLNEELLGYDTDRVQRFSGNERAIGVRAMFGNDHKPVYSLTSGDEKGDFKKSVAIQSGIPISRQGPPILLVIKKNVSILNNLIRWLSNWGQSVNIPNCGDDAFHIPDIPALIIDDECDYASINTKWPERDEEGQILEEWDPTKTNMCIRQLVKIFDKSAYIGYTATPYANIFIDKDEETHPVYGEDLFPRSFIVSLPVPSNYLGPDKVFGLESDPSRDIDSIEPLPLIRDVEDHADLIPDRHKKTLSLSTIPDSMKYAIKSFILSCAARSLRQHGTPHNTMLIHVTRFTMVQNQLIEIVTNELRDLMSRVISGENLDDFREIWENDYEPTTDTMREHLDGLGLSYIHQWSDIKEVLAKTTRYIKVKEINGTSRDYLDYREVELYAERKIREGHVLPWEERGLSAIVIGGDKLSRGLTLEGLTISYYLRASKMYDTLMQMGRWFGYRDGYSDLCRIFTTEELFTWYRHIASATQELREEINYMHILKKTPEEFGLKVRNHPGRLVVTSAGKRRRAEKVQLSYEGCSVETVSFDRCFTENNFETFKKMINVIEADDRYASDKSSANYHWRNVDTEVVINFLRNFKQQEDVMRTVKASVIADYIEKQNQYRELINWDIVIISIKSSDVMILYNDYAIGCVKRTPFPKNSLREDFVSIKRLLNPADEALDLSARELELARSFDRTKDNKKTGDFRPSGKGIRCHGRPKERGLLLIYFLHGSDQDGRPYGGPEDPLLGFGISFPGSETAIPIEYTVNTVYADDSRGEYD